ncbi:hypothetical protein H8S37_07075 [Mediterraneibacter sp. NSJ-55]|uniref:Uncharacterized protein n=1 Tax=Mediterraneibacter hominis TaxID=2763054 RepID=A0A923LIE6_9FIRM|nr:hypothetical protein [Mediterraneibacter hominis]MBC5688692.1 hypothetical protein [Mediterraneibacter hominis]
MDKKLFERIGIDRTEVKGFHIKSLDFKKLRKHQSVTLEEHGDIEHQLENGSSFAKLKITDNKYFGTFFIGTQKRNTSYILYTRMDITIQDRNYGNLCNSTMVQYKERLIQIQQYLSDEYGIIVDISELRLSTLEINCTFEIKHYFHKYHRALNLMMYNLPDTYGKISEYKKKDKTNVRFESETFYRGNQRMQIKIYDKKRQLHDAGICSIDQHVMRIEFVLKTAAKIKEVFGTNKVNLFTDSMITNFYNYQFYKLFVHKYQIWRQHNSQFLHQMIIKHKKNSPKNWQRNLLTECRNIELQNRIPVILEIEDLFEQIKLLDKSGHYARTKTSILKKMNSEDVYLQHDAQKVQEILTTVYKIYKNMNISENSFRKSPKCGELIKY